MQPQLTECTRQSLENAQNEARTLHQEFVGTEHLFLGLLKTGGCLGKLLKSQHIDAEKVHAKLATSMTRPEAPPVVTGRLPMSPKAQRALNASIVRAMSLRESKVSTRIFMLSLIEDSGGAFEPALRAGGGDMDLFQRALLEKPVEPEE